MNYWEIKSLGNRQFELVIFVNGEKVDSVKSHSERYLSSIADSHYKAAFNEHTLTGWKYSLV
jgi:hypothetical protein